LKLRAAYLSRQILEDKAKPERAMETLRPLAKPGDAVADLGANIGMYALELSTLVGPAGMVYSFEPIAANFQILEDVVRKRGLSNVQLYRAAAGSAAGHQDMVVPNARGFIGFYSAHFVRGEEDGHTETVEVLALDDLWNRQETKSLDFIKADVAGAELEVIAGASSLIAALRPGLLVGVSRRTGDSTFTRCATSATERFCIASVWKRPTTTLPQIPTIIFSFIPNRNAGSAPCQPGCWRNLLTSKR
jgi:FkbM family methyltransferase